MQKRSHDIDPQTGQTPEVIQAAEYMTSRSLGDKSINVNRDVVSGHMVRSLLPVGIYGVPYDTVDGVRRTTSTIFDSPDLAHDIDYHNREYRYAYKDEMQRESRKKRALLGKIAVDMSVFAGSFFATEAAVHNPVEAGAASIAVASVSQVAQTIRKRRTNKKIDAAEAVLSKETPGIFRERTYVPESRYNSQDPLEIRKKRATNNARLIVKQLFTHPSYTSDYAINHIHPTLRQMADSTHEIHLSDKELMRIKDSMRYFDDTDNAELQADQKMHEDKIESELTIYEGLLESLRACKTDFDSFESAKTQKALEKKYHEILDKVADLHEAYTDHPHAETIRHLSDEIQTIVLSNLQSGVIDEHNVEKFVAGLQAELKKITHHLYSSSQEEKAKDRLHEVANTHIKALQHERQPE